MPDFDYLTNKRFSEIPVTNDDILSLIRNVDKNKSCGSDGISARMLSLCNESIVFPLKLIFRTIIYTGVYPDLWKQANVTPIHKNVSNL